MTETAMARPLWGWDLWLRCRQCRARVDPVWRPFVEDLEPDPDDPTWRRARGDVPENERPPRGRFRWDWRRADLDPVELTWRHATKARDRDHVILQPYAWLAQAKRFRHPDEAGTWVWPTQWGGKWALLQRTGALLEHELRYERCEYTWVSLEDPLRRRFAPLGDEAPTFERQMLAQRWVTGYAVRRVELAIRRRGWLGDGW